MLSLNNCNFLIDNHDKGNNGQPSCAKVSYLVSAIISVYNCEKFIRGCLEDLEQQTIADRIEIVAVNSGSQQNEKEIIREYQNKYSNIVYLETKERETIYKAWNRGIKAASGKYITNANSDDRHRRDALDVMSKKLEENADIDFVYINQIITENENEFYDKHTPAGYCDLPSALDKDRLLFSRPPHCGSQAMWRKSLHENCGYFDEKLEIAGDFEFWLRIVDRCKLINIDEYLGLYLYSPNSAGNKNWDRYKKEDIKIKSDYLLSIKNEKRIYQKLKKQLSLNCADLGNYYLMNGNMASARQFFCKGIQFYPAVIDNYKLLFACYLPRSIHPFLRKLNHALFD